VHLRKKGHREPCFFFFHQVLWVEGGGHREQKKKKKVRGVSRLGVPMGCTYKKGHVMKKLGACLGWGCLEHAPTKMIT
jgi:hypothetical protein